MKDNKWLNLHNIKHRYISKFLINLCRVQALKFLLLIVRKEFKRFLTCARRCDNPYLNLIKHPIINQFVHMQNSPILKLSNSLSSSVLHLPLPLLFNELQAFLIEINLAMQEIKKNKLRKRFVGRFIAFKK